MREGLKSVSSSSLTSINSKFEIEKKVLMEQSALKDVNSCWITNISFYLETSVARNSKISLNVVQFFNASVN